MHQNSVLRRLEKKPDSGSMEIFCGFSASLEDTPGQYSTNDTKIFWDASAQKCASLSHSYR